MKRILAAVQYYHDWDSGYSKQQGTRPQTLGYGLTDSPAGLAAWMLVHPGFKDWNYGADPAQTPTKDEVLDLPPKLRTWMTVDVPEGTGRKETRRAIELLMGRKGVKSGVNESVSRRGTSCVRSVPGYTVFLTVSHARLHGAFHAAFHDFLHDVRLKLQPVSSS